VTMGLDFNVLFSPQPVQELFLSCDVFEVMMGGGRGAGKSVALLCDFAAHAERYGDLASGLIVRREATELRDLIKLALKIFKPLGYSYNGTHKTLKSPRGATLVFDHLWDESDAGSYQGWSLTWIGIEEAGEYPDSKAIDLLRACLRGPVPCYLRMTANPGGPGNGWLKARFVDPCPGGYKVLTEVLDGVAMERLFIPCTPYDNPINLRNNPRYIAQLKQIGSPELQAAWILGQWNISVGCYFSEVWAPSIQVLTPFELPRHWQRLRGFDWGSSKPSAAPFIAIAKEDLRFKQAGQNRLLKRGSLVAVDEWYPLAKGKNGEEVYNKGLDMDNEEQGQSLAKKSAKYELRGCVADPSIFDERGGKSVYEQLQAGAARERYSLEMDAAPNQRVAGWLDLRRLLRNSMNINPEEPGLYFFSNCIHLIRTLPALLRDKKDLDDLDSDMEDHLADALRYINNSLQASSGGVGRYKV
jgi:hypothetical protein